MNPDITAIRSHFPALNRPVTFLDNPGGTQVAASTLQRMQNYLVETNANHGGSFDTSRLSDASVDDARSAMADFLNASRREEIVFGPSMTSLTFNISRSLGRTLQRGDTLVVTRLDHDANISPWLLVAEDRGCRIRWVDFHPEDCTLDLDDLRLALEDKPRLVAVGYASNAAGTINPLASIIRMAHNAGALVYVDAVQYAPHGLIDVRELGCDFLVCSAYKFFGPHAGILYGRYSLLEELPAYRVRPAPALPPGKFETGTGNFEAMAGVLGAVDYLEWLGEAAGSKTAAAPSRRESARRRSLRAAMAAIHAYELEINRALLGALQAVPGLTLYGISDPARLSERVPTFAFTLEGKSPRQVAEALGAMDIYVWDGNFYALAVTERLKLEDKGGLVRVGATHYNTLEEVARLGGALQKIAANR